MNEIARKFFRQADSIYSEVIPNPSKYENVGWSGISEEMKNFIINKKPSLILELGSYKGNSAIAMAKLLRDYKIDGIIVCVDTWLGSSEHLDEMSYINGFPNLYDVFLNNVLVDGLQDFIVPFPQTTTVAFHYLKKKEGFNPDLIYVDACHDYAAVLEDLKNYWQILKPGGMICGDDISWPSVRQAIDEFFKNGYNSSQFPFWSKFKEEEEKK